MADFQSIYRIVTADLTEFSLQSGSESAFAPGGSLEYDVSIEQAFNDDTSLFNYRTAIGIRRKDDTIGKAQTVTIFHIFEPKSYIHAEDPEKPFISPALSLSVGRVALGLTRGLLAAKFKEAGFPNIILPLLPFEY
jgi:hypothetical protein